MSVATRRVSTRGVVFIHSAPAALCPHIAWALESALGSRVSIDWTAQPAAPGHMRGEYAWIGEQGTGARLASTLRGWQGLRYEVTEDPSAGSDGSRWSHTPSLGIHHSTTSVSGDVVVGEERLKEILLLAQGSSEAIEDMLGEVLGTDWDNELEPFRYAGDGAPVRWLHKVG
ncbi:uncharacterized protein DUF3145 [Knoellia remsis]|uniref:Uncharacterized protein DUF3145 n=1 Tax=Knoellia remsis TaxID=407159 RepID=A0A2T0V0R6_9MICO|nr:DUF3145 domain-containing protein [Knoellia remsis]PRY63751.1 uncharacterized protein DUF3145 [Knoellia remsis]